MCEKDRIFSFIAAKNSTAERTIMVASVLFLALLRHCSRRKFALFSTRTKPMSKKKIPNSASNFLSECQNQVNLSSEELIGVQFWMVVVDVTNNWKVWMGAEQQLKMEVCGVHSIGFVSHGGSIHGMQPAK